MVKWPSFIPSGKFPSYKQRYYVYTDYATNNGMLLMLFYTGNESQLEQYIDHTACVKTILAVLPNCTQKSCTGGKKHFFERRRPLRGGKWRLENKKNSVEV